MQEWIPALSALGGAIIGVLGAIGVQWFGARHSERAEQTKWEHEKAAAQTQAIREFRRERARPVLDALDRASGIHWLPWEDLNMLMDETGYSGETIAPEQKEAYEKERTKRLRERFDTVVGDMSSVARIPDDKVRLVLYRALWKGVTRPETEEDVKHMKELDEAYRTLEKWVFVVLEE